MYNVQHLATEKITPTFFPQMWWSSAGIGNANLTQS